MKVKFNIPAHGNDWHEFESSYTALHFIAEQCAHDYYDNHDGWECREDIPWQIDLVDEDGKPLGSFEVEAEYEITFSASLQDD